MLGLFPTKISNPGIGQRAVCVAAGPSGPPKLSLFQDSWNLEIISHSDLLGNRTQAEWIDWLKVRGWGNQRRFRERRRIGTTETVIKHQPGSAVVEVCFSWVDFCSPSI